MTDNYAEMTTTDLRCGVHPARLFARLRQEGVVPPVVEGLNLIEFSCRDCRNVLRKEGEPNVERVLHRYNLAGELVETVKVFASTDADT